MMIVTDAQDLERYFNLLLWMFAILSHEGNDALWIDTRTSKGWSTFYVNFIIDKHELWNLKNVM
jgi:hypothetical protein